jgi:hypothetical protein
MNRDIWIALIAALVGLGVGLVAGWYGGQTGVAYASIDLTCGDKTYTVSTGNKQGECQSGGAGNNAICTDNGNKAEVNCTAGCKSSHGSGSCTVKSQ